MSVIRRFLLAPSLVRLIRKERGGARVTEGYFAPQAGRTSFVRIAGQDCHLVLVTADAEGRGTEERTEVPRAHGDALLDVCSGKAAYERTSLSLGGREVTIDRYVTPAGLDIANVAFDDEAAAAAFAPPAWFGPDVSSDAGYERHAVALKGVPAAGEIGLTNAALDAVLDLIEPRFGFGSALRRSEPPPRPTIVPPPEPAPVVEPPAPAQPQQPAVAEAPSPPEPPREIPEPPKAPEPAPAQAEAPKPEVVEPPPPPVPAPTPVPAPAAASGGDDAKIDDVIESLSAALSAAIQQPREPAKEDEIGSAFERWTVRPRRTNQQT